MRDGAKIVGTRHISWVLVAACALACTPQRTIGKTQPALRVTTRLVEVNVVVHDKKGAPVAGLKRSDFTILDGGKKQQIASFSVESASTPRTPSKPLPPNVFSNRVARSGGVPTSATAILLEGVYTGFGDQTRAREQLIKFLRQLRPTDRVALYTIGTRLTVIQDFTSDPTALIEALRHYSGRPAPASVGAESGQGGEARPPALVGPAEAAAARFNEGILDMVQAGAKDYAPCSLTVAELKGIQAIAHRLSGLPGRKSLIWVTGDIPLPGELPVRFAAGAINDAEWCADAAVAQVVLNTIRDLNQADVALYPVDARGLFTNPTYDAARGRPPRAGSARTLAGAVMAPVYGMFTNDAAMGYWASETGGRAFDNTNDIRGAIRDALDDSELSYTLGYYPNDVPWKGEYRHIKVLVDQKDVRVRYRRGYYATTSTSTAHADPIALLSAAADSPLDSTGIDITVRIKPIATAAPGHFLVTVYIDAHGLSFHSENGHHDTDFVIWAAQYSRKGEFLGATSKTVSATLDEAQLRKAFAGGLPLSFEDTAKPGAWQLRIAVRDTGSGSIGSVIVPLRPLNPLRAALKS